MTKVKVIGIGGSGSNTISRMAKCKIRGVDLVALNTDLQSLKRTRASFKIQIGRRLTKGLGTGMDPEIGRQAAEEQEEEIKELLRGSDMIFITGGMGGGTCTGAAPVVARIAKELGILTVGVVTKPFSFEGAQRMRIAEEGLQNLKDQVDTLLSIANNKLLRQIPQHASVFKAFWICDDILRQAVQGISDLILLPGIINVDFADVKAILKNSGTALFGIGRAKGEKRAVEAANLAISSSLIGTSLKGAKGVLFNISGSDVSLLEVNQAATVITQGINPRAKIIFGAVEDPNTKKGEIKITVIATQF